MSKGDCLIVIDGVTGEAEDSEFPKGIEVLEWKWGAEMADATGLSQGGTNARADMNLLEFHHYVDAASPNLMEACISNRIIKRAFLVMRRAGGEQKGQKFITLELLKARVAKVEMIHKEGLLLPLERVSLSYQEANYDYVEQARTGAKQSGAKAFKWRLNG